MNFANADEPAWGIDMLHERLRRATAERHRRVDAAYSRFDLTDRAGYLAFLSAQARALGAAERALTARTLPPWSPRAPLLDGDLHALGACSPAPDRLEAPLSAQGQVGLLYVLEGSRLGAQVLARRIADGWPRAFLSAAHPPGAWRAFRAWLDAAGADAGPAWTAGAVRGAEIGFDLFERAASPAVLQSAR